MLISFEGVRFPIGMSLTRQTEQFPLDYCFDGDVLLSRYNDDASDGIDRI